jgi:hypothetical protein
MLRRMTFLGIACLLVPASIAGANTVMHTVNGAVGNQSYSSVGLQFDVLNSITVTDLGVFSSSGGAITPGVTLTTVLFDASQNVLATMDFDSTSGGPSVTDYVFTPLGTPVTLTPGIYTLAAYGFNLSQFASEHNTNIDGSTPDTFTGAGLISFVQSVWGGGTDPAHPTPVFPTNTGAPDYFSGPNMAFEPSVGAPPVPEPVTMFSAFMAISSLSMYVRKRIRR